MIGNMIHGIFGTVFMFFALIVAVFLLPTRLLKVKKNALLYLQMQINTLEILNNAPQDKESDGGWYSIWDIEKHLNEYEGFENFPDDALIRLESYGTKDLHHLLELYAKREIVLKRAKPNKPHFRQVQYKITKNGVAKIDLYKSLLEKKQRETELDPA